MDAERIKQTVDYIKARHKMRVEWGDPSPDVPDLLEITDHLQKTIEAQAAALEIGAGALQTAADLVKTKNAEIAAQAKTIATNAKYANELQGKISELTKERDKARKIAIDMLSDIQSRETENLKAWLNQDSRDWW